MVNSVTNTSSTTNTANATSEDKSILGKDDFLQLMIAQLKYQNPLDPMDGTQYASQLAQFSSLEQLSNLNSTMQQGVEANLILAQSVNNTTTANMIGKEVKMDGADITYNGQDEVNLGYDLDSFASSIELKIYDSTGKLVKTITNLEKNEGEHKLSWDCTDNNGKKVGSGSYTAKIFAKNSTGNELSVNIFKHGIIESVRFTDSGTKLVIGGVEYLLSDISEITGNENEGDN